MSEEKKEVVNTTPIAEEKTKFSWKSIGSSIYGLVAAVAMSIAVCLGITSEQINTLKTEVNELNKQVVDAAEAAKNQDAEKLEEAVKNIKETSAEMKDTAKDMKETAATTIDEAKTKKAEEKK